MTVFKKGPWITKKQLITFFENIRNLWHIFSHKINCDIICIYVIYNMRTSFAICAFHMYLRCKAHVLKYETPAMISNKCYVTMTMNEGCLINCSMSSNWILKTAYIFPINFILSYLYQNENSGMYSYSNFDIAYVLLLISSNMIWHK